MFRSRSKTEGKIRKTNYLALQVKDFFGIWAILYNWATIKRMRRLVSRKDRPKRTHLSDTTYQVITVP